MLAGGKSIVGTPAVQRPKTSKASRARVGVGKAAASRLGFRVRVFRRSAVCRLRRQTTSLLRPASENPAACVLFSPHPRASSALTGCGLAGNKFLLGQVSSAVKRPRKPTIAVTT